MSLTVIEHSVSNNSNGDLVTRSWSTEQAGPNDKPVDIWYNGKWVPAYFKDIRAGDFFLTFKSSLDPDRCFLANADVKQCGTANGHPNFILMGGMTIVQAPAIKDINTIAHERPALPNE